MYSSLYGKPNPFRSFTEFVYVGLSTAISIISVGGYIWRVGVQGAMAGDWVMIVAILLGLLVLLRLIPSVSYIARIPLAISIGGTLGISLRAQIFTGFVRHVKASIVPFFVEGDLLQTVINSSSIFFMVMMLTFMLYTTEHKGAIGWMAKIGEAGVYLALGPAFAQTFMGRLGVLVGFVQDLVVPQWKAQATLAIGVLLLATIVIMDRNDLLEKYAR